jgi:CheY-like chemotaxis protein
MGAIGSLTKPVKTKAALDETFHRLRAFLARRERRVLLAYADPAGREQIAQLISGPGVEVRAVESGAGALTALQEAAFDCAVLGIDQEDMKTFDLIDEITEGRGLHDLPMIVYSHRALSKKEELHLKRLTQSTALKDVRSTERLVDETALFLHRPVATMPEATRQMLEGLHHAGAVLAGKKVLIVDDDIRNIFAMTSILEPHNMQILAAETGRSAIEILQATPDVDVVLMDIMMPDMDGYDTMRAIRKQAKFRALPIIALTAKAMKGDREKCIEAGASDYISKPVDTAQILSLLRVWLHR